MNGKVKRVPVREVSARMVGSGLAVVTLSALVGWGLSYTPPVAPWEVGALLLLLAVGLIAWRTRVTHPLVLFPLAYLVYFLLGAQDWVDVGGYSSFRSFSSTNSFMRLPDLGLIAYMLGVMVVLRGRLTWPELKLTDASRRRFLRAGALLAAIGFSGAVVAVIEHGLVISHPEARSGGLGFGALTLIFIPAGLLLALAARTAAGRVGVLGVAAVVLMGVVGFRYTVVVLILSYIVFKATAGQLRRRTMISGVVLLVVFAALVQTYRLGRNADTAGFYGTKVVPVGVLAHVPVLTPLYYSTSREGSAVFNRLVEVVPRSYPFMNGKLQFQTVRTVLPNSNHLDSRDLVTGMIAPQGEGRANLTPTILGGPYVDFGLLGILAEMSVLGMALAFLYRRACRGEVIAGVAYSFFLAVVVAGIHTGLLDVEVDVLIPMISAAVLVWAGRYQKVEGATATRNASGVEVAPIRSGGR